MSDERVVCLACGAVNRLPAAKDHKTGRCGSCGAPLFPGGPADVDAGMLRRQVEKGTLPVVIDVWAPWCGPCKVMAPEFEKVARRLEPAARFLKLNSDNEQDLSRALNIRGIPTTILFKDGKEVDRVSGAMQASQLGAWLSGRIG